MRGLGFVSSCDFHLEEFRGLRNRALVVERVGSRGLQIFLILEMGGRVGCLEV